MEKALFSISCTTCRARLAVRSKDAIGAILECPKCQSMVLVTPPEDWEDPEKPANPPPLPANSQTAPKAHGGPTEQGESAKDREAPKDSSPSNSKLKLPQPIAAPPVAVAPPILTSPSPDESPVIAKAAANGHASNGGTASRQKAADAAAEVLASATVGAGSVNPRITPAAEVSSVPASKLPPIPIQRPSEAPSLAFTPADVVEPSGLVARINAIVSGSIWAQALVLGVSAVLGLTLVVGGGMLYSQHREQQTDTGDQDQAALAKTSGAPANGSGSSASIAIRANAARFDAAWIPDDSCLIVNFAPSRLDSQPEAGKVIAAMGTRWQWTVQSLVQGLGLELRQVQRITWASSDFGAPEKHCVVLIELNRDVDASRLTPPGAAVDARMQAVHFQQVGGGLWPLPYALLDPQTIVTGDLASLKGLAQRSSPHWIGTPLERLAKSSPPDSDLTVLIDMASARRSRWTLPMAFDVWPAGRQAWDVICEKPLALGASMQWSDPRKAEIALACDGDTAADQTQFAVQDFVEAAKRELPQRIAGIAASLRAGEFAENVAASYKALLDRITAALQSSHCKSSDGISRLQFTWSVEGALATGVTTIESATAWKAAWRKAAQTSDAARQRSLLQSLNDYAKAQKPPRFPGGIAGEGTLLSPDTRLSWLATLLPYCGHDDWHRQLDFRSSWNIQNNRAIAERTLAQVVNPALGEAVSGDGYPVTHYVGVAGVGKDAALEPADSRRAGMFGFGRQTLPQDLERGAANTIAILGVSDKCGPWAQGGHATVRALEHRPYVNGPDGFGSGQPDGMLAGMADGAVRFVSKDCNPEVLEQLAAVHGPNLNNSPIDLAALDPGQQPGNIARIGDPLRGGNAADVVHPQPAAPQARQLPPLNQPRFAPPGPAAPPDHTVAVRLKLPLAKIRLPKMTLGQDVQTLAEIGNLSVSYDLDALEEAGASLRDPIEEVELNQAKVEECLEAVLEARNLTFEAENKVVLVTSPPESRTALSTKQYTVSDLTGGNAQAAVDLAAIIARMVAPESWQAGGGPGTVESTPNMLRIRQTAAVHFQVLLFCEKLRIARGLPPKSHQVLKPEQLSLATRWQRVRPELDKPISLAFREQTPLATILAELGKAADVDIVVDQVSLAAAGMTNLRAKLLVDKMPLERALNDLVKPLGLVWRAVDAHTLQIASTKTLSTRLELEFYNAAELLAKEPADALVHRLQTALGSAAWAEGDGSGVMIVDIPAKCLIVLQTPAKQMELGTILAEKKP